MPLVKTLFFAISFGLFFGHAQAKDFDPPSAQEVEDARFQCEEALSKDCLHTLALGLAYEEDQRTGSGNLFKAFLWRIYADDEIRSAQLRDMSPPTVETLLDAGQWAEAEKLFLEYHENTIFEFGTPRGPFIKQMILAQLEQGEIELAIQAAGSLGDVWNERLEAHLIILEHLLDHGNHEQALKIADNLTRDFHRAAVLSEILVRLVSRKEFEVALRVAHSLKTLALDDPHSLPRVHKAYLAIARGQLEAGEVTASKRTLELLPDLNDATDTEFEVFIEAADLLLKLGNRKSAQLMTLRALDAAEQTTRLANDDRVRRLAVAGRFLVWSGMAEKGRAAFEQAEQLLLDRSAKGLEARMAFHVNKVLAGSRETTQSDRETIYRILRTERTLERSLLSEVKPLLDAGFDEEMHQAIIALDANERRYRVTDDLMLPLIEKDIEAGQFERAELVAESANAWVVRAKAVFAVANKTSTSEARRLLNELHEWAQSHRKIRIFEWTQSRTGYDVFRLCGIGAKQVQLGFVDDAYATLKQAYSLANKMRYKAKAASFLSIAEALDGTLPNAYIR
ncbi:tetratricopeptide repeat protein [Roseibium aggregatum]|uniref:tetratricopeptide repeat protein n=1 Tax=Roseibium aggregatum TaxID=187304 RepID=UPI003A981566